MCACAGVLTMFACMKHNVVTEIVSRGKRECDREKTEVNREIEREVELAQCGED